jgi:hypothetical protein
MPRDVDVKGRRVSSVSRGERAHEHGDLPVDRVTIGHVNDDPAPFARSEGDMPQHGSGIDHVFQEVEHEYGRKSWSVFVVFDQGFMEVHVGSSLAGFGEMPGGGIGHPTTVRNALRTAR